MFDHLINQKWFDRLLGLLFVAFPLIWIGMNAYMGLKALATFLSM